MEINEKLVTSFLEILFELKKLEVLKLDLWNSCKILEILQNSRKIIKQTAFSVHFEAFSAHFLCF